MFLTEQFRLLQQRLEDAIPTAKRAFLQQFYSQVCNNLMFSFCTMCDLLFLVTILFH